MTRRVLTAAALALAVALPSTGDQGSKRDLSADEQRGGHTLARHVGRTDEQLRRRLRDQPNISAASTYPDRETAELVVGLVLWQSTDKVTSWTCRRGSRPNLALRTSDPRGPPIGRVLQRGARTPVPARGAVVVLRWDERRATYFVLTSYPENR